MYRIQVVEAGVKRRQANAELRAAPGVILTYITQRAAEEPRGAPNRERIKHGRTTGIIALCSDFRFVENVVVWDGDRPI